MLPAKIGFVRTIDDRRATTGKYSRLGVGLERRLPHMEWRNFASCWQANHDRRNGSEVYPKLRGRVMQSMDQRAYLERIGYSGPLEVNLSNLEALAWAHLTTVPFENFDVHLGRTIRLDTEALVTKIVKRKRGGFCYELNGLFALLLRDLGYQVDLLSARVFRQGTSGQDFDHMVLRVQIDACSYLVDVGFGDGSTLPMELRSGAHRDDRGKQARLHQSVRGLLYEVEDADGSVKGYELSLKSREMKDFQVMCRFHQSSARSWFTTVRICILHTEAGTRSFIEGRLTETGLATQTIHDPGTALTLFRDKFEIDLPRMPDNKSNTLSLRAQLQVLAWESRARRVWSMAERLAA